MRNVLRDYIKDDAISCASFKSLVANDDDDDDYTVKKFSKNLDIFLSEFLDLAVRKKFQTICLNHQSRFFKSSEEFI